MSSLEHAFVIDMIALKDSKALDEKLSQIFTYKEILGFSFNNDILQF